MTPIRTAAFLLALASPLAAAQTAAEPAAGVSAVAELGRANGAALACQRLDLVNKAKAAMVARVPKTRRYGEAFEEATDAAFREQTADRSVCPPDAILSLRIEAAVLHLDTAFPASDMPPAGR